MVCEERYEADIAAFPTLQRTPLREARGQGCELSMLLDLGGQDVSMLGGKGAWQCKNGCNGASVELGAYDGQL